MPAVSPSGSRRLGEELFRGLWLWPRWQSSPQDRFGLMGNLLITKSAFALIVFVHGSGSGRLSPRNVKVAEALGARGMATLLFDLPEEESRSNVFDINMLVKRLIGVVHWLDQEPDRRALSLGFFLGPDPQGVRLFNPRERHRLDVLLQLVHCFSGKT